MPPFNLFSNRNKIDTLKIDDLRKEESRLDYDITILYREINAISDQKKAIFNDGIGADMLKKEMLALKLKELEMSGKMKLKEYKNRISEKTFVSNLITIKKFQDQLKDRPIWKRLRQLSPEELKRVLADVNVRGENSEMLIEDLNAIFEISLDNDTLISSQNRDPVFDAWECVENGSLSPEAATEDLYSIDKDYDNTIKHT